MANKKTKPVVEFREGLVKAAVFEREVNMANKTFTSQSVSLQISYTDKDDKWQQNTLTILKGNLAKTIRVLTKAATHCGAPQ